ncbi:MAG: GDSL-type esterase/lipase family protein [Eubacteriales bacterium]|nr:GDSL-type esterase/lipase family protein [Eubacteriales bacterium]
MTIISKLSTAAAIFLLLACPVHAAEQTDSASIDVPVSIVWEDQEDNCSARPSEVKLMLLKNGLDYQEITLSAAQNWTTSITELPAFSLGTDLTAVSSDDAAKWETESVDESGQSWLQYTADSNWATSEYDLSESSDSSAKATLRVINSTDTPYLAFFENAEGDFLSDQSGSIVKQCPRGETDFSLPDNASCVYVSHLNSDELFSVQTLDSDKKSPVVYSICPGETVPGYTPEVNGTSVTYTAVSVPVSVRTSWENTPQSDAEFKISITASGKTAADAILSSSNNWQTDLDIFRQSPFIYFSNADEDTSVGQSFGNTPSLFGHWFSILGDSLSEVVEGEYGNAGEGYGLDCKWWYQAASSLGMKLLSNQSSGGSGVNVSTSDDASNTAYDRIPLLKSDSRTPDDILILLGINDLIRGRTPDDLKDDYRRMLDELQDTYPQANLILFTYPQVYTEYSSTISQCNQLIRQTASEYGLVVIDFENWPVSEEESALYLRTDDALHPNRKGQLLMGEIAAEQLEQIPVTNYHLSIQESGNYDPGISYKDGTFTLTVSSASNEKSSRY